MVSFFRCWLTGILLSLIKSNEEIREELMRVCADYYRNRSLREYRLWGNADRLKIGLNVQINNAILNTVSGSIEIGDNTFFGHSVSVLTGTHEASKINRERQLGVIIEGRNISIGQGVWIASNATILGPCTIGDHAVIGAGAVVTGDVPPCTLFAGMPAKMIKKIV